jgi:ADP-ribosyl-[dinitrogen reductase] hydrolase
VIDRTSPRKANVSPKSSFADNGCGMATAEENFRGILLGLAVGDALGTTLEFGPRRALDNFHTEMIGGGAFGLAPGQWTDDTAMAVGMGRSLIQRNGFQPLDMLSEWSEWYLRGKHSCTGTCFDIGNATRSALDAFLRNPTIVPEISASSLGNGTLMRLAPVVLFASNEDEAESLAYEQSVLTHGEDAAKATGWFGRLLFKTATSGFDISSISADVLNRKRNEITSSGFYKDTLEAAIWAVGTTSSFEDAVIQAVNLGGDADTVGAVTGQFAGAVYGESSIPNRWLKRLAWRNDIRELADLLIGS